MNEEWKDIPGYEGVYRISNSGRVMRVSDLGRSNLVNRILKCQPDPDGYLKVELRHGGVRAKYGVHQLVASAFIGACPMNHEVNHKDLNKANNTPGNLEYMTHHNNVLHARSFGVDNANGSQHGLAKLNEEKVADIKAMLRAGYQQKEIAAKHNVNHRTIHSIAIERTWRHVK